MFKQARTWSLDARHILFVSAALIVGTTAANGLFHEIRFAMGYGYGSFLPGPNDRYADLVKVGLSFKAVTWQLVGTVEFENWPGLFRDYLLRNPYGDISSLAQGTLTHFHHPPLSQLFFTTIGYLIVATGNPVTLLWLCFGLYGVAVLALVWRMRLSSRPADAVNLCAAAFLCLASYPALLVFLRGNYTAGYTSILSVIFLVDCLGRRHVTAWSLLALAIAINIRPTAAVFMLALPLTLGLGKSARYLLWLCFLVPAIFLASLGLEHALYPDYTLSSFLRGLDIYKALYIFGSFGDAGNASLWALIKNGASILEFPMAYYPEELARLFIPCAVLVTLVGTRILLAPDKSSHVVAFVLVALYVLLAPVSAEYHLLVFVGPLIIAYINKAALDGYGIVTILIPSALLLAPKNYVFVNGLSLQTLLNPALLTIALVALYRTRQLLLPDCSTMSSTTK